MNFVLELFLKMMKFMCKKELFQSLAMKNEFHTKFRDENNSLTLFFFFLIILHVFLFAIILRTKL